MKHHLIFLLSLLCLCNCAGNSEHASKQPLTPIPAPPIDPEDSVVISSVRAFIEQSEAPNASQFDFTRIDLDNDGRRDALVMFKNPYGYWCDMHGCTMLVLKAHDDSFSLINAIQPVREPLYIDANQNNGWKDLIVRVSGRWNKAKNVKMRFNGQNYPQNPSSLPPENIALNEFKVVLR